MVVFGVMEGGEETEGFEMFIELRFQFVAGIFVGTDKSTKAFQAGNASLRVEWRASSAGRDERKRVVFRVLDGDGGVMGRVEVNLG